MHALPNVFEISILKAKFGGSWPEKAKDMMKPEKAHVHCVGLHDYAVGKWEDFNICQNNK